MNSGPDEGDKARLSPAGLVDNGLHLGVDAGSDHADSDRAEAAQPPRLLDLVPARISRLGLAKRTDVACVGMTRRFGSCVERFDCAAAPLRSTRTGVEDVSTARLRRSAQRERVWKTFRLRGWAGAAIDRGYSCAIGGFEGGW